MLKFFVEGVVNYEEFERKILKVVYEDNIYEIQPSELAFSFDLSIEDANSYLEMATQNGILDVDFVDNSLIYFVPGMYEKKDTPVAQPTEAQTPIIDNGADGTLINSTQLARQGTIAKGSVVLATQTSINPIRPVAQRSHSRPSKSHEMMIYEDSTPVEAREDLMFSNASRTMFSRKIFIKGDDVGQDELVTRVTNLFRAFGYRHVEDKGNTVRFERGSIAFLVALLPLFVLIVPMFVYLFLSVLGRSTIQKEPILLDVKFEKKTPYWEIDLIFLGLHGVVLGPADQKVLNREIDTLRDELEHAFRGAY